MFRERCRRSAGEAIHENRVPVYLNRASCCAFQYDRERSGSTGWIW